MSTLFNISSRYGELLEKIDLFAEFEPDTDADGNYLDPDGNIIHDLADYRAVMTETLLDTLDAIDGEMADKLANCGAFVKQLNSEVDALEAEIKSLRNRSAPSCQKLLAALAISLKREIESFKTYIMACMDHADVKKVDQPLAKLTIRNNPESVSVANEKAFIDWAQIMNRDDLLRYSAPDINKTAIKTALNDGQDIPGVQIVRTKSLMIK